MVSFLFPFGFIEDVIKKTVVQSHLLFLEKHIVVFGNCTYTRSLSLDTSGGLQYASVVPSAPEHAWFDNLLYFFGNLSFDYEFFDGCKLDMKTNDLVTSLYNIQLLGLLKQWQHVCQNNYDYIMIIRTRGMGYFITIEGANIFFHVGYKEPILLQVPPSVYVYPLGKKRRKLIFFSFFKKDIDFLQFKISLLKQPDVYKQKGLMLSCALLKKKKGKKKFV